MRIQAFARALGVCADTIRRAERRGLLSPIRDWAGHRRYTEADLAHARAVLFKSSEGVPCPKPGINRSHEMASQTAEAQLGRQHLETPKA
jgi:DNA-binding transcriptional MerR regulator